MKQSYVVLKDVLSKEYREAFDYVEKYTITNLKTDDESDERILELLDIMMEAQSRGDNVETIVGSDLEAFCKEFYSDYNSVEKMFSNILTVMKRYFLFVLIIELFYFFTADKISILNKSDIVPYVGGLIAGVLINAIVFLGLKPVFKNFKKLKTGHLYAAIIAFCVVGVVVTAGVADKFDISMEVPRIVIIIIAALYLVGFYGYMWLTGKGRFGINKKSKKDEIAFDEAMYVSCMKDYPKSWLKQFEKKKKKGMTEEEFLKRLEKKYDYKRNSIIGNAIFGIAVLGTLANELLHVESDVVGTVTFMIFFVVIQFFICRFFNKMTRTFDKVFRDTKEVMDREGLTLEEYINSLEFK